MATRSKARKSASRKTRNGDSYKGIPADKRKHVALTVGLVRAAGKRTTPGDVYLQMAQDEAAKAEHEAERAEQRTGELLGKARTAFEPALSKLVEAWDLATAIEGDKQHYLPPETLARCIRLMVWEVGEELEQALCDLGLVPEDDFPRFVGERKSRLPQEARAVFWERFTRWSKTEEEAEVADA
jgi:hypothetical protein